MANLDVLVEQACSRSLSPEELSALCTQAAQTGQGEEVVLRLLRAGTVAGRANLLAAKTLTQPHQVARRDESVRPEDPPVKARRTADAKRMSLPFILTHHAVERYIDRYLHGKPFARVEAFLIREARSARRTREKTFSGEALWVGPSGTIFVVKRVLDTQRPICVTILLREEEKVHFGKPGAAVW